MTKILTLIALTLHVIIIGTAAAPAPVFNITRILENHPNFAAFNGYLTSTGVAGLVNSRRTITVLALDDAAANAAFSGKAKEVVKDVLSAHVVLDFYGPPKLHRLVSQSKSSLITTLFQASGRANGLQGFINVSAAPHGEVAFGSGVKGSPPVAKLIGSVALRPYDISIVQISAAIFPPGVDPNPSPPPPPQAAAPAPVQVDDVDESQADSPVADSPEEAAEAPEADAPTEAVDDDDAPASSPAPEDDLDDDSDDEKDTATIVQGSAARPSEFLGFGGFMVVMGISFLLL